MGTHRVAKDKDGDGESGDGSGVVVELFIHEADAGGEHGGCQGTVYCVRTPLGRREGGELPDERDATDKKQGRPLHFVGEIPAGGQRDIPSTRR